MAKKAGFTRVFENPRAWLVVLLLLFATPLYFSFRAPQPKLPPILGQIPDFTLTNQDGREVTWSTEYKGSVLLVNFIFTSCPSVCPLLSKQMEKVQTRLLTAAPIIRLVTITVDPGNDTPEVLKAYGKQYGARFRSWSFLTGDLMQIHDTVVNGFHVAVENPVFNKGDVDEDANMNLMEITHGEHFVLVDQMGNIRSYLLGNTDEQLDTIVQTLGLLANTNPEHAMAAAAK